MPFHQAISVFPRLTTPSAVPLISTLVQPWGPPPAGLRRTSRLRARPRQVYSRRDRHVSHPLALLNAGGGLDDDIMSQANSLNSDFRIEAMRVLEVPATLATPLSSVGVLMRVHGKDTSFGSQTKNLVINSPPRSR